MSEQTGARPPEDLIFRIERQTIMLDDFASEGHILDVGGGGEGIIGILKGEQVIAIDPRLSELEEAAPGPLKIIMDGRDLKFMDASFNTATAFFTFGYIKREDHAQVFSEVFRVLRPGGRFLIWDVSLPARTLPDKKFYVIPLEIHVRHQVIETGYGVPWHDDPMQLPHYQTLAQAAGFEVLSQHEDETLLTLVLQKK